MGRGWWMLLQQFVQIRLLRCRPRFFKTCFVCFLHQLYLLLFFLFPSFFYNHLVAQQIQVGASHFYEGLSKGLIKAVTTDEIGFVWIATDEGLIRFDGKNSLFFKDALPGGFAKGFLKRPKQSLLVVHDYGVTEIISRPDTTYFQLLVSGNSTDSADKLFFPKSLYQDRQQRLWIGENQSVSRLINGKLKKYRFPAGTNTGSMYSLYRSFSFAESDDGQLWAMAFSGELYFYNERRDIFIQAALNLTVNNASSFVKTKRNTFLIGAGNGLFEVEVAASQVKNAQQIAPSHNISGVLLLNDVLYVGTWSGGLFKTSLQNTSAFTKITQVPFNDILTLSHDPHNGLWVGGSERVVLLTGSFFESVPFWEEPNAPIEVVGVLPDSTVVIGTWENFYFLENHSKKLPVKYTTVPIRIAPTALLCEADRLWIGTLDGSVFYYDLSKKSLRRMEAIQPGGTPITKMVKDAAGNLWMSGNKRYGLLRLSANGQIKSYRQDGLRQSRTVYRTPSGVLLVGGSDPAGYLFCYFPTIDSFVNLRTPLNREIKGNFQVNDLLIDQGGGTLWLATSRGLWKYHFNLENAAQNKVERIHLQKVPPDEPIRALQTAEDGTLWVSTTSGLVAYKRQWALLYDQSSGLPSNNLTGKGLLLDFNGNFWVGTSKGLARLQRNVLQHRHTPAPIFTTLKINDVPSKFHSTLQLTSNANLEINFLSLSFPSDKLQYQTRLIGEDTSAWSPPSAQTYRVLSNLSPGSYTLQVRAQQQGGFWWSAPGAVTFSVRGAWYRQWWAIGLFTILFSLLFTAAVRLYNWRLLQQKKRLEALVSARTEEIKAQDRKIMEQNEQYRVLKEKQLQEQLENKNKQLMHYTLHLIQKNESLRELQLQLHKAMRQPERRDKAELRQFLSLIDYSFRKDEEWEKFKLYFENVHHRFFEHLLEQHPSLTPQELRLCALIRLNLSIPEIATILGISADSVKNARFRIRKKMELAEQESLVDHVMKA